MTKQKRKSSKCDVGVSWYCKEENLISELETKALGH